MTNSCNILYDLAGMSQPTSTAGWATAFAIMINYRRSTSYTAEDIAESIGRDIYSYGSGDDERAVANEFNLSFSFTRCDDLDTWSMLLSGYGPLYVSPDNSDHAIVIFGLRHDDNMTEFQLYDPWKGEAPITVKKIKEALDTVSDDTSVAVYY